MKYLYFWIFLLILSTLVNVNEAFKLVGLRNSTNFTLENGVPVYKTHCYNYYNCTKIITFYPNSNPNSFAIIELGTEFSNYNISYNTSYTVNDSNVELVRTTYYRGYSVENTFYYYFIEIFMINLTSEISCMNDWDAMDHVYRRCEASLGGIPPSDGPECYTNLQCSAYVTCIDSNLIDRDVTRYMYSQVRGIYYFLMTYIIIIPYIIGLFFSVLNVVLFIQLKSLKSSFMMFVAIQSFYCIFWFLCFFLYTAYHSQSDKSVLGLQLGDFVIGSKSINIQFSKLHLHLMYLCSFGIETIRFFKALSRTFALLFSLWSADKLRIKHALFSCLGAFIIGIIAWIFVVLNETYTYTSEGLPLDTVISICTHANRIFYILFGWGCFPQYVLYDELFPLNLITLLLDCYVLVLLKLAKLNDQQKKREKLLKLFIVMDLIDVIYSCLRRILFFVYFHNYLFASAVSSSTWGVFYYNAFARYIILTLYTVDNYFFLIIRLIFYAVEMIVCQVVMRRIQAVENPHYVPKNVLDRFLQKFTKKFYTNVLRVQPTAISNTTNLTRARS